MDVFARLSALVGVALALANFAIARRAALRDRARRKRDDDFLVRQLLAEAWEKLYGKDGYVSRKRASCIDEAEHLIKRALLIDPKSAYATEYEGHVFELRGNHAAAKEKYRQSIRLNPNRARAHCCLGQICSGQEAMQSFERAISLEPESADLAFYGMGLKQESEGQLALAEQSLLKAIEIRPRYASAKHALARVVLKRRDVDGAIRLLESAVEDDSQFTDAMVNLGQIHMVEKCDDETGLMWIKWAQKIAPNDDYPTAMLAAIYADRGDATLALDHARAVRELSPMRLTSADSISVLVAAMRARLQERVVQQTPPTVSVSEFAE